MSKLATILCALLLISPNFSFAKEPVKQCANLISECYAADGLAQSNCLFSSSKHPFCEGTTLGKLMYKRWGMSSVRPIGLDAPAFLGPKLINQKCVSNFDNKIVSTLLSDEIPQATLKSLEEKLDGCTKDISNKLTRP